MKRKQFPTLSDRPSPRAAIGTQPRRIGARMTPGQQHIQITAKLYECRDAARTLLGERYTERMTQYGSVITHVAEQLQIDPLAAATRISKKEGGFAAVLILAAGVELVEPTPHSDNQA